ncbi:MAG: hypothetical protein ABW046_09445 [Actinoplanes sp.]
MRWVRFTIAAWALTRVWRSTLTVRDSGPPAEGGAPPRIPCLTPSHRGHPPHEANRLTAYSAQCLDDGAIFLLTWCPTHAWEPPLASEDFQAWSCAAGDEERGLLCPACPGIGSAVATHWTCRYDPTHVFWARPERCAVCKVGFLTATAQQVWQCQVCGSHI